MQLKKRAFVSVIFLSLIFLAGCRKFFWKQVSAEEQLLDQLQDTGIAPESRFSIISIITGNYIAEKDYNQAILFLTDWVERHPEDEFNTYWLFMTAYIYQQQDADVIAAYYFERILQNYPDILVKEQSVHFLCLQNLIRISNNSSDRIRYFNDLINRFSNEVSIT